MKLSDIRKYINAGLNDEQIRALVKPEQPAPDPVPAQAKGNDKEDFAGVITALNELKETIQASNIAGAKNKEPETIDDILQSLIIDE